MNNGGWCDLCDAQLGRIELATVRLAGANAGQEFSTGWRCVDRDGCRARVAEAGKVWPLRDRVDGTRNAGDGFSEAHHRAFAAARAFRERARSIDDPEISESDSNFAIESSR